MEVYCVSFKEDSWNQNQSVRKTNQNKLMLSSNCSVCGKNKSTFIKNQDLQNFKNIWND